jgi:hypothetical protein
MGNAASPTEMRQLDSLLERIVARLAPEEVWLFGSRAEGRARPDSDYDLLMASRAVLTTTWTRWSVDPLASVSDRVHSTTRDYPSIVDKRGLIIECDASVPDRLGSTT